MRTCVFGAASRCLASWHSRRTWPAHDADYRRSLSRECRVSRLPARFLPTWVVMGPAAYSAECGQRTGLAAQGKGRLGAENRAAIRGRGCWRCRQWAVVARHKPRTQAHTKRGVRSDILDARYIRLRTKTGLTGLLVVRFGGPCTVGVPSCRDFWAYAPPPPVHCRMERCAPADCRPGETQAERTGIGLATARRGSTETPVETVGRPQTQLSIFSDDDIHEGKERQTEASDDASQPDEDDSKGAPSTERRAGTRPRPRHPPFRETAKARPERQDRSRGGLPAVCWPPAGLLLASCWPPVGLPKRNRMARRQLRARPEHDAIGLSCQGAWPERRVRGPCVGCGMRAGTVFLVMLFCLSLPSPSCTLALLLSPLDLSMSQSRAFRRAPPTYHPPPRPPGKPVDRGVRRSEGSIWRAIERWWSAPRPEKILVWTGMKTCTAVRACPPTYTGPRRTRAMPASPVRDHPCPSPLGSTRPSSSPSFPCLPCKCVGQQPVVGPEDRPSGAVSPRKRERERTTTPLLPGYRHRARPAREGDDRRGGGREVAALRGGDDAFTVGDCRLSIVSFLLALFPCLAEYLATFPTLSLVFAYACSSVVHLDCRPTRREHESGSLAVARTTIRCGCQDDLPRRDPPMLRASCG